MYSIFFKKADTIKLKRKTRLIFQTQQASDRNLTMSEIYLEPKIVGNTIAFFRKRKNISQEVLSGLSAIGRTHLSAIERGERKPTLETLYRISCALGVSMSEIVKEIEKRINKG